MLAAERESLSPLAAAGSSRPLFPAVQASDPGPPSCHKAARSMPGTLIRPSAAQGATVMRHHGRQRARGGKTAPSKKRRRPRAPALRSVSSDCRRTLLRPWAVMPSAMNVALAILSRSRTEKRERREAEARERWSCPPPLPLSFGSDSSPPPLSLSPRVFAPALSSLCRYQHITEQQRPSPD